MTRLIEHVENLGYKVEEVVIERNDEDDLVVYNVSGFGVQTQVKEDDLKQFLVPEAHEHRLNTHRHNDPDDDFTMSDEDIFESNLNANIAVGLVDTKDVAKTRKEWKEAYEDR